MWQYNVEFATSPNKHKSQKYSNVSVSVLNMKFVTRQLTDLSDICYFSFHENVHLQK